MSVVIFLLGAGLTTLTLVALVLSVFLLIQVLSARKVKSAAVFEQGAPRETPCIVIIPAHNEASVIDACFQSVLGQLQGGDCVLVVADNCSDDTAQKARQAGAHVLERRNTEERGKGYALAAGVEFAVHQGWMAGKTVVVFVDADCILHENALGVLVEACTTSGLPQQALYLMHNPPGENSLRARIAELAWRLKNKVRPLGATYWGMGCPAMGTGMALPWQVLKELKLASGDIVEDMRMGIDLQRLNVPMQFCVSATVTSEFPADDDAAGRQRQRWEHGHLATLVSWVPPLLLQAFRNKSVRLAYFAIDLSIPPLTFFSAALGGVLGLNLLLAWVSNMWLPAVLAFFAVSTLVVAILTTWWFWARDLLTASELFSLPSLVVSKFPIYRRFFTQRETNWVKTDRD